MVVVVRTDDLTHEFILARQWMHQIMGEPCPCGDDTPGRVPVHTALKNLPFSPSRRR